MQTRSPTFINLNLVFFLPNYTKRASAEHLYALATVFLSSHTSRAKTQRNLPVFCRCFDRPPRSPEGSMPIDPRSIQQARSAFKPRSGGFSRAGIDLRRAIAERPTSQLLPNP